MRPHNSTRRGIGNDASIVVLLTWNCELQNEREVTVKKAFMSSNLFPIEMQFLSCKDQKGCEHAILIVWHGHIQQSTQ